MRVWVAQRQDCEQDAYIGNPFQYPVVAFGLSEAEYQIEENIYQKNRLNGAKGASEHEYVFVLMLKTYIYDKQGQAAYGRDKGQCAKQLADLAQQVGVLRGELPVAETEVSPPQCQAGCHIVLLSRHILITIRQPICLIS